MSAKPKTSRKSDAKPVDQPFAAEVVAQAAKLVPRYRVIISYSQDDECFVGEGVELPNAVGAAETEAECIEEVRENMRVIVMHMLERGETPPLATQPVRNLQVNVRFAPYEKAAAEALARSSGLSLSDYIRTAALSR